jgi:hypothetical protein
MVYNLAWNNEVQKIDSDIFEDPAQIWTLILSIFTYLESTHFSENSDISYMIVGGVQAEEPFNAAYAYTRIALSNHHGR